MSSLKQKEQKVFEKLIKTLDIHQSILMMEYIDARFKSDMEIINRV